MAESGHDQGKQIDCIAPSSLTISVIPAFLSPEPLEITRPVPGRSCAPHFLQSSRRLAQERAHHFVWQRSVEVIAHTYLAMQETEGPGCSATA